MSRRSWILIGALVIAAVVLGVAWVRWDGSASRPLASAAPSASTAAVATTSAPPAALATASPDPTPSSDQTAGPDPSAAATPIPRPPATAAPRATGPPRLAYAAFLSRVNDDRATVETLNGALSTGAQAQDPVAVRRAAVDILDFVDTERDWLRENPPAECYADAHAAAGTMLDAYGSAADAFIAWAETGGGFGGLGALGKAVDAAQTASDALTAFGQAIDATRCLA